MPKWSEIVWLEFDIKYARRDVIAMPIIACLHIHTPPVYLPQSVAENLVVVVVVVVRGGGGGGGGGV